MYKCSTQTYVRLSTSLLTNEMSRESIQSDSQAYNVSQSLINYHKLKPEVTRNS